MPETEVEMEVERKQVSQRRARIIKNIQKSFTARILKRPRRQIDFVASF